MDIFDLIQDATKEANSFANHPAKELSLEERLLYLNGLSLVMNADAEIDEDEKEYIRILIKSFELDESCLNDMVAFAQSPDKDTIQAFFRTFRRKPLAQLFLFDAYMMAMRDGVFQEKEMAVIDKIAEQLEILKGTKRDIFDLFCHIKNKNWQESSLYFSSHLLNPEHFKHLLDYYEVDQEKLVADTKNVIKNRLIESIKLKINVDYFEWIKIDFDGWRGKMYYEENITKDFIPPITHILTHEFWLPFIQYKLNRGEIRVSGDVAYKIDGDNEFEYFRLSDMKLEFNKVDVSFSVDDNYKNGDYLNVHDLLFIDFLSVFIEAVDVNESLNINKILDLLFGSKILIGAKYARDENKMPLHGIIDQYHLEDEIIHYEDNKYFMQHKFGEGKDFHDKGTGWKNEKVDLNILDVLKSGKIRLMR